MEKQSAYCEWCGHAFELEHGNSKYCCNEHGDLAKKFRQEEKYSGVSSLLPILNNNHSILHRLSHTKREIFNAVELESEGMDFSLFRRLYPERENLNLIRLDFGTFYLETEDNYQTFKLSKHETKSRKFI
jgi:hypothetical protein